MSESESKGSGVAGAAAEIIKAVPVYQDALQPAAKQVGLALEVAGRTVNLALAPVRALVWGGEKLEEFLQKKVGGKLSAARTPEAEIITPRINVVAPAIEALRFTGDEVDLQEMYANLIATAMDKRVAQRVLPFFVEIVRQLTSDEARILRHLAANPKRAVPIVHLRRENAKHDRGRTIARNLTLVGYDAECEFPDLAPTYLDNLARLGLIQLFPEDREYAKRSSYSRLENDPHILATKQKIETENNPKKRIVRFVRSGLDITALGADFIQACVIPYEKRSGPSDPTIG